jgi:diaminopimelate decarboxylase
MTAEAYARLARDYGTPLYVYDLDRVLSARQDLFDALPEQAVLYYAVKANPHPELASALREGNGRTCRAEISSTGELSAALAAGFTGSDCLYTGPGKTAEELSTAMRAGVHTFSAESVGDLRRLGRVALAHDVRAECMLRLNGTPGRASTSIRMTGVPSQFGFDVETLPEVMDSVLGVPGATVVGAHCFPLSNSADEDALISEFEHTAGLMAHLGRELGLPLRRVDIGGGFAAPYAAAGVRPVYKNVREALEHAFDRHLPGWRTGETEVAFESGRYLVADSGVLLTSVTNVKTTGDLTFAVMDAGINALGGMSGLGRLLPSPVTPTLVHPRPSAGVGGEPRPVTIAGPLCTPGDILAKNVVLPQLVEGDVLAVPNIGAYGPTASLLLFLGRPAPREVVLRDGEVLSVSRLDTNRTYA